MAGASSDLEESDGDSSFLGDEDTKNAYQEMVESYSPEEYWKSHEKKLQVIACRNQIAPKTRNSRKRSHEEMRQDTPNRAKESTKSPPHPINPTTTNFNKPTIALSPSRSTHSSAPCPYNPYEGEFMAKQLSESLSAFLSRLPPSSTTVTTGPWIWIANPLSPSRPINPDLRAFRAAGLSLLDDYRAQRSSLEQASPSLPPGSITRKLDPARATLERNIANLACTHKVTSGKWMLFPPTPHVDDVWATVAKATLAGTLGDAAKVATDHGNEDARLVGVYTASFADADDVARVLRRLVELGLVNGGEMSGSGRQGIYYKCDAYTHLGIASGNEFKLKASMYGSREMLKDGAK